MLPTPDKEEDFNADWVLFVLKDYFERNERDPELVKVLNVSAQKNEVQGILSTTFVVDVEFQFGEKPVIKRHYLSIREKPMAKSDTVESARRNVLSVLS